MSKKFVYKLDDAGRAAAAEYVKEWTAIAFRTGLMDEAERETVRRAVTQLYEAASLTPPRNIVIAPGPMSARFAAGAAAAIWHQRNATDDATDAATDDATDGATDDATDGATYDATRAATTGATDDETDGATRDATGAATYDATYSATEVATDDATRVATYEAARATIRGATYAATHVATSGATYDATFAATGDVTYDATGDATHVATFAATYDAIYDATRGATEVATNTATNAATRDATNSATWYRGQRGAAAACFNLAASFGLACAQKAWRLYQGGSSWAASCAHIAFGRDYVGLEAHGAISAEQYRKYQPWEDLARISGFRYMHAEFCIVTDRPLKLTVDSRNRPHCDDGPFAEWADGTKFYAVHGVRVPWDIIERPETLTVARIDAERNAEVRRVMLERFGVARYVRESVATVVHADADQYGRQRRLLRHAVPDDEPIVMVEVTNSTAEPDGSFRTYMLRVDPNAYDGRASRECHAAVASTFRRKSDRTQLYFKRPEDYAPRIET